MPVRNPLPPGWRLALTVGGLLLALTSGPAQVVNLPPTPAWLGGTTDGDKLHFRHPFVATAPLLKAVVHVAASGPTTLLFNDNQPLTVATTNVNRGHDVTALLLPGANEITVIVTNATPRLALRLELNAGVDGTKWVTTGAGWESSRDGITWAPVERFEQPANDDAAFSQTTAVDAYNSWRLARDAPAATPAEALRTLPGFRVELIRSAQPGEGSWIAMTFDAEGRLILAREKRGLIRLELDSNRRVTKVEEVDDTLEEVRGLLYAYGWIYAHANRGQELVRLGDRDEDGRFELRRTVLRTEGGFGHGRNKLQVGTDGRLYVAFGNNVKLPSNVATNSSLRRFGEDQLIPCPWDRSMFDGQSDAPGGFILRMNRNGSEPEIFAGGFRNPMGIAANTAGELFTFDADMEWDVGAPWYMPNRVLHVVSGADYGWRRGTGRFPVDYPDTLPSVADIGLASPTAVTFGPLHRYPIRFRTALYVADWAYGRILAVHLGIKGGAYIGTPEVFVSGRPLNVTDVVSGPDERLWFITGGRGTQSGLYRIVWHGESSQLTANVDFTRRYDGDQTAVRMRRKVFEQDHTRTDFDRNWEIERSAERPLLEPVLQTNRFFRHSRRLVLESWLESSPPAKVERLLASKAPKSPDLLLALTRARIDISTDFIVSHLLKSPLSTGLDEAMTAARTMSLAFIRRGAPDETLRRRCLAWVEAAYPHPLWQVNHELIELLVYLNSGNVIAKTLPLLAEATRPEDLLQYTFYLRLVRDGWTAASRRAVFDALRRAAAATGAKNYYWAVRRVREEFIGSLTPEERAELAEYFAEEHPPLEIHGLKSRFVKEWQVTDFAGDLAGPLTGRSLKAGRSALVQAQCTACHRVGPDPLLPAGLIGPDLQAVGARFGPRDLLDHIINPSKVIDEKYRATVLILRDGEEVSGNVEHEDEKSYFVRQHPLAEGTVRVDKSQVKGQKLSPVSTMPAGLLNTLNRSQVLDLIAYLHAGGDARHAAFANPPKSAD